MDLRVLGPVEVLAGGKPLPLGGPRQQALLAFLALHPHEPMSVERLLDELFHQPPANGTATVHTLVSRLRRTLGGRLDRSGGGYVLALEAGELDLDSFRSLLAEAGAASDPAERSRLLRLADGLWRGRALDGLDVPFAAAEARALEELRLGAIEDRIEAELEDGRELALVSELVPFISRYPLRERLRAQLILALYRTGRQAEALDAYQETRRMLDEELGLEPGAALRELERAILRHDPLLDHRDNDHESSSEAAETNLRRPRRAPVIAAIVVAAVVLTTVFAIARDENWLRRSAHARLGSNEIVAQHGPPPAAPPNSDTISDSFDGSQIDSTIWYEIRNGTGWDMSEHDHHLEFVFPKTSVSGGAYHDFGGHVGTLCQFPGDFDARVHFDLVKWPPGNRVYATLFSFLGPESAYFQSSRTSNVSPGGEQYVAYTGYWTNITVDDRAGTLRVARRHGVVTSYFLHNGRWQSMASARNSDYATIAVGALASSTSGFGSESVVVDFTDFSVTGVYPVCPPGATAHS